MKIAVVYTSTTPELTAGITEEITRHIGTSHEIVSYQNAAILQEAREHHHVTPKCARMLHDLYEQGVREGADVIFNVCSSVGDVAKAAKPYYESMGIRFVRIDHAMAVEAVAAAKCIGVIATLDTTLQPTKNLLADCAAKQGKSVEFVDALAEGAFGLNPEQFKTRLIETGKKVAGRVDALVLAQGSMTYAEKAVSEALGLPVFSSISRGVRELAETVKQDRG